MTRRRTCGFFACDHVPRPMRQFACQVNDCHMRQFVAPRRELVGEAHPIAFGAFPLRKVLVGYPGLYACALSSLI